MFIVLFWDLICGRCMWINNGKFGYFMGNSMCVFGIYVIMEIYVIVEYVYLDFKCIVCIVFFIEVDY